jgi:hypothetical protein
MMSSQDSADSFTTDIPSAPTPVNAQETARNNIIREMVETERKYVQDLEIMQVCVFSPLLSCLATHSCGAEILQCVVAKQHHFSRYNTPSISGSQQVTQLPAQIPHPIGKHCRGGLERPALGSPFHRECESAMLLFRLRVMLNAVVPLSHCFRFGPVQTIGRGICCLRTLLCQLHQRCRPDACRRAELDGTFLVFNVQPPYGCRRGDGRGMLLTKHLSTEPE